MSNNTVNNKVVCFGEVLWDVFDGKHFPGGAPLNVTYHLNRLGIESTIISRVGNDELGNRLIDKIEEWNLDSSNCQIDGLYPTSEVYPIIADDHEVCYDIKFPVAWDFITYNNYFEELLSKAEVFIFGSLVARDITSRETLLKVLKLSSYSVFDVNLRELHYNKETIFELLHHTHLLKMNQGEIDVIMNWLDRDGINEAANIKFLQSRFNIGEIIITKGVKGAVYYAGDEVFYSPIYLVDVKDTVGAGDSFLASFVAGKLSGLPVEMILKQSAALSAFVASNTGACPDYELKDLIDLIDSPIQLNAVNLPAISPLIKVPGYNRKNVRSGIAHIGIGAFHRAHQAYFVNKLLEEGSDKNWGICGIALLERDKKNYDVLKAQDGLYTLMVPDDNGNMSAEVIGSIIELLYAPENPQKVIQKLADPNIKVISLTITEGGYNFTPDGFFNWDNEDVQWDLSNPDKPKTVFGYLYASLKERSRINSAQVIIQSCDNLEHNGDILKAMLCAFIEVAEARLIEWINKNVAFPNSMVDRITPATSSLLKTELEQSFGLKDGWPVMSESFYQWIIEDSFIVSRPEWERVGAQMVADVSPYEVMKIRLLNGGHSLVGLAGYLLGYQYIYQIISNPLVESYLKYYMDQEVSSTLKAVSGIDLDEYKLSIIQRFKNPFIKDGVERIISGSSAKLPKFILPTVMDRIKNNLPVNAAALIVASWYSYLHANEKNQQDVNDDKADELFKLIQNPDPLEFLRYEEIFGELAKYPSFTGNFLSHINNLSQNNFEKTLEHFNESTSK